MGPRYSFICQGTSTRRQRRDFFGFRVKLPRVTTKQSKHANVSEANPLSALPKATTSDLARPTFTLSLYYAERQVGKLWIKGVGRKFSGRSSTVKQDQKIAPLSLPLLYQYHLWKSIGVRPLPAAPRYRRPWLWIPTFKVIWLDSAKESNPSLPTFITKISKFYCSKDFKRKRTFQLKTWSIG